MYFSDRLNSSMSNNVKEDTAGAQILWVPWVPGHPQIEKGEKVWVLSTHTNCTSFVNGLTVARVFIHLINIFLISFFVFKILLCI